MKHLFTFTMLLLLPPALLAQGNILLVKKHGKTVQSFFEGNHITFDDGAGMTTAYIYKMQNDSLFLAQFDVRRVPTTIGSYYLDTVATYRSAINYKNILVLENSHKSSWSWKASGASLFGGGTLLATAGLLTWVFAKKDTRYYARPGLVITGAVLAGVGYLLMRSTGKKWVIGKKYSLQYISTN